MSLDTQTKQTLASMSWARLTWRDRLKQSEIRCYGDIVQKTEYFYDGQHKNSLLITTETLSQMEVVSWR